MNIEKELEEVKRRLNESAIKMDYLQGEAEKARIQMYKHQGVVEFLSRIQIENMSNDGVEN